ncbi:MULTISPECIES: ABC transporter permease [unclassified Fusibacter]|uniref:ABC transporter permease n=1 Tax=unclassified Fusibacter TaxID=2624464 RepID=UPI001010E0B5|nr:MULTISPECIES: ABC transporter permease [unclassified Fusibacter]MCK8059392.1 ABC transporter permease [Fusibacter sp. A2]NPE21144.1 ABC transporter permease [Fusibacter sp. A1]RXV62413.1 ABC transporter permease [Fusibacter sp. A1]
MTHLIAATLKRQLKWKNTIIIQLALILLTLFMQFLFSGYETTLVSSEQIRFGVASEDTHPAATLLINSFATNENFTSLFTVVIDEKDSVIDQFNRGTLDAYIIIPEGFSYGLMYYENKPLSIYTHADNPVKNRLLEGVFNSYSEYVTAVDLTTLSLYRTMDDAGSTDEAKVSANEQFSVEMITAAMGRGRHFTTSTLSYLPKITTLHYILLALPLSLIAFMSIGFGLSTLESRQTSTFKRLLTTGTSPLFIVMAEIIAQTLQLVGVLLPVVLAVYYTADLSFAGSAFLAFILCSMLFVSIWRSVSYMFKDAQSLSFLATIVTSLLVLAGGGLIPFVLLPLMVKKIGVFSPIYLILRLAITGVGSSFVTLGILMSLFALFVSIEVILIKNTPVLEVLK